RFQSNRPNPLDGGSEDYDAVLQATRLYRDQSLAETDTGMPVERNTTRHLITRKELEKMRADTELAKNRPDITVIFSPEFAALHEIVPGVYLTGTFGLEKEAMKKASIALIINATNELPLLNMTAFKTYRVPVEDNVKAKIDVYFDDVADLIEAYRRSGAASVVHGAAG